jgi:hypothetical protein
MHCQAIPSNLDTHESAISQAPSCDYQQHWDKAGVGPGLSVARTIAQVHGDDVTPGNCANQLATIGASERPLG